MSASVRGYCDSRFSRLRDALAEELGSARTLGHSVAVVVNGETVAHLWGGFEDEARNRPWREDTMVCLFSAGKVLAAAGVLRLIERGKVELDAPLMRYWPELGAHGKQEITVRHALAHWAGVPIASSAPKRSIYAYEGLIAALEQQQPLWPPGTQGCFHSFTHGLLTGELIQRADGRRFGQFFREEFAKPHGLSLAFSLTQKEQSQCADLSVVDDNPLLQMMHDPATKLGESWQPMRWEEINSPGFRACNFPSLAGHGSALGLARFHGMLANGGVLEGQRVLDDHTVSAMLSEQWHQLDPFMGAPVRMGLGVMLSNEAFPFTGNSSGFAQPGVGGVAGLGDSQTHVGIGIAPNRLSAGYDNPFLSTVLEVVMRAI